MFLLRLIYLKNSKPQDKNYDDISKIKNQIDNTQTNSQAQTINKDAINQIKNVSQEKKINLKPQVETKTKHENDIKSFNELIELCIHKKEAKLKYELEKNVNLVKFEKNRIEISFNENLDKYFVKNLSTKLLEWTNERWIISFSKNQGEISVKDKLKKKQIKFMDDVKNSDLYKKVLDYFPDAELIDVRYKNKDDE